MLGKTTSCKHFAPPRIYQLAAALQWRVFCTCYASSTSQLMRKVLCWTLLRSRKEIFVNTQRYCINISVKHAKVYRSISDNRHPIDLYNAVTRYSSMPGPTNV